MVVDEEGPMIYHTLENTRIYQEKEMAGLAIREAVSLRDSYGVKGLPCCFVLPLCVGCSSH